MKRNIFIIASMVVLLAGCRQKSDNVLNYAYQDNMAFGEASKSYAAKFDVFWQGMNANYALWDFEEAQGLDWDAVYDEYYPKFKALDEQQTAVTDAQLQSLLEEVAAPLHDGHLAIQMQNHATGNFVAVLPSKLRKQKERPEEYAAASALNPTLYYYTTTGDLLARKEASTNTMYAAMRAVLAYIVPIMEELNQKASRTEEEEALLTLYMTVYYGLESVVAIQNQRGMAAAVTAYNELALRYEYAQIPGLDRVSPALNEMQFAIEYGLFKGNIAYLRFNGFKLTAFLNPAATDALFGTDRSASTQAVIDDIADTWRAWFNAIQEHQKAGDLGGVIIDVRSNGGGYLNDFRYVIGALVPSGGFLNCKARFKRGTGRYDYSPVMPQEMLTMDEEHVTVTAPIAVLCNCNSVSMAEHTSMGAKLLDNGRLIGTRTHGGFCALTDGEGYTNNYSGYVGVQNTTPVFCYIPQEVAITLDDKIIEGYGIEPDIEVPFNTTLWAGGEGPDNQINRALEYIRTGN